MRTVFHVTDGSVETHRRALLSVSNLLADSTVEDARVAVVANAAGVRMLTENPNADRVRALQSRGVRFVACRNSVERVGFAPGALLDGVEVAASGVGELARLQEEGYGYVKL
ncbi:hypothetical protein BRC93_09255 [Halobacteriales archaeon QS_5_70_15]|nr:MAG: hypothetical protein BRC93_09255 [Halobacteriales archaeon QS_5_70_15]